MTAPGVAIPGVTYLATSTGGWVARGRTALDKPIIVDPGDGGGGPVDPPVNPPVDRSKLVPGTYMPNSPLYAGLRQGTTPQTLTNVYPNSSGYISITTPGPYENLLFWGEVRMQSLTEPLFRNCAFAGREPSTYTQLSGLAKCYGDGYYQWRAEDCLFDPMMWGDATLTRPGGAAPTDITVLRRRLAYSAGVHGGRVTLKRCEIRNSGDGFNFVQTITSTNPQAATSFTLVEGCWIHKMNYYWGADWTDTVDGAHCDCFQFNTGRNVTLRGNYLGGVRDNTGYLLYNGSNGPTYSYNTGDDAWNAGNMIKQEVGIDDARRLENILIEKNFYEGGAYGINHYYSTTRPWLFTSTQVRDNFFVRRGDSKYITRSANFASLYSNNRVIDKSSSAPGGFVVAELAPIQNG